MGFLQKVYYNDKPLVLCVDKEAYMSNTSDIAAYSLFNGASPANFIEALRSLEQTDAKGAIITDNSGERLLAQLHSLYPIIDAGGGVTYNESGHILMIFRRGKWDLPKGKLDDGESIEECAVREVSEETGLKDIILEEKITETYHIYEQSNRQLLKRTAWYRMKGSSLQLLEPQKAENIIEARWVRHDELGKLAEQSYEAVREVLKKAGLHW